MNYDNFMDYKILWITTKKRSLTRHILLITLCKNSVNPPVIKRRRRRSTTTPYATLSLSFRRLSEAKKEESAVASLNAHCRSQRQQIPPGKQRPFGMTRSYGLQQ